MRSYQIKSINTASYKRPTLQQRVDFVFISQLYECVTSLPLVLGSSAGHLNSWQGPVVLALFFSSHEAHARKIGLHQTRLLGEMAWDSRPFNSWNTLCMGGPKNGPVTKKLEFMLVYQPFTLDGTDMEQL